MTQDTTALIEAVRAEKLLAGSTLLTQVSDLRANLRYKSDDKFYSYDEYFLLLQTQIEKLPRVVLQSEVAPHTESQYQVQLGQALEKVFDDCERITTRLLHFLSKLRSSQERMEALKASFVAWYSLATGQYLKQYDIDLGKTVIADLARAEFERLMEGLDVEVASLVTAVQVQIKTVNKRKQISQDKFNLGKDQANAVWTGSLLPGNIGTCSDADARSLLVGEEDEEEPYEAEEDPTVNSALPASTISSAEVTEIRGAFHKIGDACPVRLIPGDSLE